MNKVLVAGVDTVVGGNVAVCLARTHAVTGVSLSEAISLKGCDLEKLPGSSLGDVEQLIRRVKPQQVIFCGAGSRTGWESSSQPTDADVQQASNWIRATHQTETHLTLISSGAIFTGPWKIGSAQTISFTSNGYTYSTSDATYASSFAESDVGPSFTGSYNNPRTVVLSAYSDRDTVVDMLSAGASAYVVKGAPIQEIVEAVRAALRV